MTSAKATANVWKIFKYIYFIWLVIIETLAKIAANVEEVNRKYKSLRWLFKLKCFKQVGLNLKDHFLTIRHFLLLVNRYI